MSAIDGIDAVKATHATEVGVQVIDMEIQALRDMCDRLKSCDMFERSVDMILNSSGRVVVIGMGKSGIIGKKIVATLASTGTPAFFVHPGEAFHGDLGMIQPEDVIIMISNSGETEELTRLIPFMNSNRIIAMTGGLDSTLAKGAETVLDISVPREACHNNLAPTSSTTATLVMGDALAVALGSMRGFQPHDFARFHPGGSLGRRLLTKVRDAMRSDNLPFCSPTTDFREVVHTMTVGRLGLALVVEDELLLGIITDGDVRRAFEFEGNPMTLTAIEMMTKNPQTIAPSAMFVEAEERMREHKINSLVVIGDGDDKTPVGVIQIFA